MTGSGFTNATAATFDGTPGTSFTVVDDSTITTVTPAHAPGAVDVVVESPRGDSAPLTFTYVPDDAIAVSLDPTEGPDTGGTTVTITGSNFTPATAATFDGTPGTSFTFVDDSTITVVSPPHAPGAVDVVVESPLGDADSLTFTYLESPVALSLDPTEGPDNGGTTVTISGSGFVNTTGVTFDGTPGSSFTVVDDDEITVVSPAHAPGAVDVVVQSPLGDADPLTFTYLDDAADAVSITPGSGPESGGTAVTITGSNFTGATGVTFDGIAGTSFVVVDDSTITASTPPHAPGSVSVIVQQSGGDSNALAFDYLPDPASATSLTPTSGPEDGGTTVTITGSGFDEATSATFDGVAGTAFTVVDDTTISVATPPHAPGPVDVVVTSPYGDSAPLTFTYVPGPADATSIDPATGPEVGGTAVTISGDNFTDATAATFDGMPGTSFTVVSDDEITVVSPPHTPGPVDVVVRSAFGDAAPLTFTYTSVAASATSLTPASGPDTGGTTVTITGTNLTHATGVTFDGTAGTSFTVVDDTTVRVVTPAGTRGPVDVIVVSPYGDGGPLAFTYIGATRVATIDPPQGPTSGGTTVTITGACFTGAIDVTFDGVSATSFTVVDDTTITAVTPAHTAASVD
ncbi:MAG: IPT/TIG domain-containing protein, partial [Ilumatobacter fluminis]